MTNTRDIILKLKSVREEKKLSLNDMLKLIEENGDFVSRSTLSRLFADGSEDIAFRYEATVKPVAYALLGVENIDEEDSLDVQTLKSVLQYQMQRIEELERQVAEFDSEMDKQKLKAAEKLENEREAWQRSIEFLKEQIAYKDKRMDLLLDAVVLKDKQYKEMLDTVMCCPRRSAKVEHCETELKQEIDHEEP